MMCVGLQGRGRDARTSGAVFRFWKARLMSSRSRSVKGALALLTIFAVGLILVEVGCKVGVLAGMCLLGDGKGSRWRLDSGWWQVIAFCTLAGSVREN